MTDHTPTYRPDDEVTITIKGRVVADTAGGVIVEWLGVNGFPDRICARPIAGAVTVTPAEVSEEEKDARVAAYRLLHDTGMYVEDRAQVRAAAPYGVDLSTPDRHYTEGATP